MSALVASNATQLWSKSTGSPSQRTAEIKTAMSSNYETSAYLKPLSRHRYRLHSPQVVTIGNRSAGVGELLTSVPLIDNDGTTGDELAAPTLLGSVLQPEEPKIQSRAQVVAEWHGQVLSVDDRRFVAELVGVIGEGVPGSHEEAEIPVEEVRPEDLELLQAGAFFRLCVSYLWVGSTRRRFTDIVFRRMPAYRSEALAEAAERARVTFSALRLE